MTFEMEMVDEIKMEVQSDELAHHGTKGMKWGIRRYQNKDGSLTAAGKRKRASEQGDAKAKKIESDTTAKIQKMRADYIKNKKIARAQAKADAKLAKAEAKYNLDKKKKSEDSENTKPKPKSLSEMSNDELREKIERVRLEQQLAALTPQEKSKGKAFVEAALNDVVIPAAKNTGRAYLEKFMKDKLGLNEKDPMSKLKQEAEKLGYMKQIEQAKKDIDKIKNPKDDGDDLEAQAKEADYRARIATAEQKEQTAEITRINAQKAKREFDKQEEADKAESKAVKEKAENEAKETQARVEKAEREAKEAREAQARAEKAEREAKEAQARAEKEVKEIMRNNEERLDETTTEAGRKYWEQLLKQEEEFLNSFK